MKLGNSAGDIYGIVAYVLHKGANIHGGLFRNNLQDAGELGVAQRRRTPGGGKEKPGERDGEVEGKFTARIETTRRGAKRRSKCRGEREVVGEGDARRGECVGVD